MQVNIKRFCPEAPLPVRKTTGAAGYDLPICAHQHLVGLDTRVPMVLCDRMRKEGWRA